MVKGCGKRRPIKGQVNKGLLVLTHSHMGITPLSEFQTPFFEQCHLLGFENMGARLGKCHL